jgi:hypothetical protein
LGIVDFLEKERSGILRNAFYFKITYYDFGSIVDSKTHENKN